MKKEEKYFLGSDNVQLNKGLVGNEKWFLNRLEGKRFKGRWVTDTGINKMDF